MATPAPCPTPWTPEALQHFIQLKFSNVHSTHGPLTIRRSVLYRCHLPWAGWVVWPRPAPCSEQTIPLPMSWNGQDQGQWPSSDPADDNPPPGNDKRDTRQKGLGSLMVPRTELPPRGYLPTQTFMWQRSLSCFSHCYLVSVTALKPIS